MSTTCFTWSDADFNWENADYTWEDVCLVLEIATPTSNYGGRPGDYYDNYNKLNKQQKDKFINLLLKIKNKDEINQKKKKKKNH